MQFLDGGPIDGPIVPMAMQMREISGPGGYVQSGADPEHMGWDDVRDTARRWANALRAAGVEPGDRVAILAETSRNWMLADQAIHAIGAVVVPIYPTLMPDIVGHIVRDSGSKVVFADDDQVEKIEDDVDVWTFDAVPEADPVDPVDVQNDDPAVLIYTSGTTGVPKGVLLTHGNIAGDVQGAIEGLRLDLVKDPSLVAFLPLAHVAGYVSLQAVIALEGTIYFSRPDRMGEDLQRFRPTIVLAVPRLWERIVRKVEEAVAEGSPVKQMLFKEAKAAAIAMGKARDAGGRPNPVLKVKHGFYNKLVHTKLLHKLGMDRVHIAITGAAAVRPDLLWFLRGIGLPIIEGYGMTESSALSVSTRIDDWKAGTVGTPLPGTKIRLDDEEVLIGGIGVFREYWGLPDETESTRVMIDGEPWIRSGDVGVIDGGRLSIIDRKKELEKLDTGKFVAPVRVEEMLKSESSFVEDSLVVGNGRSHVTILIQPAYDALVKWATEAGIEVKGIVRKMAPTGEEQTYAVAEETLREPKVRALFQEAIDKMNAKLADFERVKGFDLVPHAFTLDRDELTPSFKKKRRTILEHHQALVDRLYAKAA